MKTIILTENQLLEITGKYSLDSIDIEANKANTSPTKKQSEAGNYKKGHVVVKGMKISIECPKGSKRYWVRSENESGCTIMKNHYGYFNGAVGYDGDQVDVFLGKNLEDFENVYVVDQYKKGHYDECKVMLGFKTQKAAENAYWNNYDKNYDAKIHVVGVSLDVFKEWLYRKKKQRKPFYQYLLVKNNKIKA